MWRRLRAKCVELRENTVNGTSVTPKRDSSRVKSTSSGMSATCDGRRPARCAPLGGGALSPLHPEPATR
eukprot:4632721-Prymnesium_polylepis.2